MVCGDWRLTAWVIARLNIRNANIWKIITEDLGIQNICTKIVPRRLKNQKECCRQVCVYNLYKTCFVELSLVMSHGFLSRTRKASTKTISWSLRKIDKDTSQSHVHPILTYEDYVQLRVFFSQGQTINQ